MAPSLPSSDESATAPDANDDTASFRLLSNDTGFVEMAASIDRAIASLVEIHREVLVQMATVLDALVETLEQNREAISLVAQIAADNADDPEYDLEGNRVS